MARTGGHPARECVAEAARRPISVAPDGQDGSVAVSPARRYVLSLDAVAAADSALVGGKALHLAQLIQAGLPALPGFCVTTAAYQAHLRASGLDAWLSADAEFPWEDVARLQACRAAWEQAALPREVQDAILSAYAQLGDAPLVAVRSSATFEDQVGASFAGQYDTFLNVRGGRGGLGTGARVLGRHLERARAGVYARAGH